MKSEEQTFLSPVFQSVGASVSVQMPGAWPLRLVGLLLISGLRVLSSLLMREKRVYMQNWVAGVDQQGFRSMKDYKDSSNLVCLWQNTLVNTKKYQSIIERQGKTLQSQWKKYLETWHCGCCVIWDIDENSPRKGGAINFGGQGTVDGVVLLLHQLPLDKETSISL